MLTRDIHSNKETINIALYDLKESIDLAKKQKEKVLCLIVGYGSTGKTHKIKTAIIDALESYQEKHMIKEFILGNEMDIFNIKYQNMKGRDLIPPKEKEKRNPGAIYIVL